MASTTSDTSPVQRAQKRTTERTSEVPSELPPGTLAATDFAAHIGMSYDDLKNYMRRGVSGEKLDVSEIPHPVRAGYVQKYFTVEQQEAARALLRRYGKLPGETQE